MLAPMQCPFVCVRPPASQSSAPGMRARAGSRSRSTQRAAKPAVPSNRLCGRSGTRSSAAMCVAHQHAKLRARRSERASPLARQCASRAYALPATPWQSPTPLCSKPRYLHHRKTCQRCDHNRQRHRGAPGAVGCCGERRHDARERHPSSTAAGIRSFGVRCEEQQPRRAMAPLHEAVLCSASRARRHVPARKKRPRQRKRRSAQPRRSIGRQPPTGVRQRSLGLQHRAHDAGQAVRKADVVSVMPFVQQAPLLRVDGTCCVSSGSACRHDSLHDAHDDLQRRMSLAASKQTATSVARARTASGTAAAFDAARATSSA